LVAPCNDLRKVANMLGYHRQARILGATRPDVNEIVVCRAIRSAHSLHRVFQSLTPLADGCSGRATHCQAAG
jgi:hypothetical protein